jgi:hypothetical protein
MVAASYEHEAVFLSEQFLQVQRPPVYKERFEAVRSNLKELALQTNQKVNAWETEMRDLQDKNQLKQFKIDKYE